MLKFIHEDKRWDEAVPCSIRGFFMWKLCLCTSHGILCQNMKFWHMIGQGRCSSSVHPNIGTLRCLYMLTDFLHALSVQVDSSIGISKLTVFQTSFVCSFYFYQTAYSKYSVFIEHKYKYVQILAHWLFRASVREAPHPKVWIGCFANKKD